MTQSAPQTTPAPRRSSAWAWAAVLIVLMLVIGIPMGYVIITWTHGIAAAPGRMGAAISQAAADAVRPRLTMNQIVVNSIADLHKENKLVAFTAVINTDVTREEGISSWGIYWGTNVARVVIRDARVQFVIDLSQIGTSDFSYSDSAKVLTLFIPRPHVDTDMVSIDPGNIQTVDLRGGWARWDKQDTRDHAIADLRPKVIAQAQAPFVKQLAEDAGIQTMTQFLQPLAETLARDGAKVKVVYRD